MTPSNKFNNTFAYYEVPEYTQRELFAYLVKGNLPGEFLTAVLQNNFLGACARADLINGPALQEIGRYISSKTPQCAYGSKEKIEIWCDLSDETRHNILVDHGLIETLFEMLSEHCSEVW